MTRAELDTYLLAGSRTLVVMALTDPTTGVTPTDAEISAWLDYPIGDALRGIGTPATSFFGVEDADLARVATADTEMFLFFAKYQMKNQLRGRLALCDMKQGQQDQKLSQLRAGLDAEVADLKLVLDTRYAVLFAAPVTAGRILLSSSSRDATSGSELG